jgi:Co/Zn/Cd efflux system component
VPSTPDPALNNDTSRHGHEHDHGHAHKHAHQIEQGHQHEHAGGLGGLVESLLRPHSHDAADSLDDALAGSAEGIRAVKISLLGLGLTALLQLAVVVASGSVGLLADTIHNFADASTAIPLWLAFALARRRPSPRYTYGYGRAEDLAGVGVASTPRAPAAARSPRLGSACWRARLRRQ